MGSAHIATAHCRRTRKTIKIHNLILLLFSAMFLLSGNRCLDAAQGSDSKCSTAYENHNQIDYGPLKVRTVEGRSVLQVQGTRTDLVVGACLSLFTEKGH